MKKGKVVLVGTGFVGMSMAYSMLNKGGVNELILIDIDKDKTIGEEMDLSNGLPFAPQKMVIKAGDYSDCKDAQVVVITAGRLIHVVEDYAQGPDFGGHDLLHHLSRRILWRDESTDDQHQPIHPFTDDQGVHHIQNRRRVEDDQLVHLE